MRKLFWATIGVALISMVFANCKKEDPTYSVQVTATEGGTVEGQNGEYKEGEKVVFKAIPVDGYYFSQWSDGKTDNPYTVSVGTSDISLKAEFRLDALIGDLGLSSGTIWATRNVGAANPWDYGDYYAWGETQTKSDYSWKTYKYCDGSDTTLTKYNNAAIWGAIDNKNTLELADDVATAVLGSDYSMPTKADWQELGNECYWFWTFDYGGQGISGYIVYKSKADADKGTIVYDGKKTSASYSLSDDHIFLPAADSYMGADVDAGIFGSYWSASLDTLLTYDAWGLSFGPNYVSTDDYNRCWGFSVRPVKRP